MSNIMGLITIIYTHPIFPFASALVGFLIGHWLAIGRDRRQEFHRAAQKLRDVFLPVLKYMHFNYYAFHEDLKTFLEKDFDAQRSAVIEFTYYLRGDRTKRTFLKAWHEYCCCKDEYHKNYAPCFQQYDTRGMTDDQWQAMFKLVETRLNNILQFANPK